MKLPDHAPWILTQHAADEIVRRAIPMKLVKAVLSNPQQVVPAYGVLKAYQSQVIFPDRKTYLLRVIVAATKPMRVITVYRISKIGKYWRAL